MSNSDQCFEVLILQSRNLRNTLRFKADGIDPYERFRVAFELRLAYNLTLRRCSDEVVSRELLGLIEECEDLLNV
ncbi:MAG: hypothetical protein U1D96_07665 [Eubacteriales bacterium]|jgi:hypothetical protein|nr:hypothetical protein [Bacillota bacterium]MBV1727587.1 hypothetical protein [Desulforudis sp.]MDP3049994.1 hypothetical protein [Eubacteriales bacterium]MDQ7789718.1 hypothetical protein [Clostridia bacterium]MBU4532832.1 hypothetical protein [Bacillota bacterium]